MQYLFHVVINVKLLFIYFYTTRNNCTTIIFEDILGEAGGLNLCMCLHFKFLISLH